MCILYREEWKGKSSHLLFYMYHIHSVLYLCIAFSKALSLSSLFSSCIVPNQIVRMALLNSMDKRIVMLAKTRMSAIWYAEKSAIEFRCCDGADEVSSETSNKISNHTCRQWVGEKMRTLVHIKWTREWLETLEIPECVRAVMVILRIIGCFMANKWIVCVWTTENVWKAFNSARNGQWWGSFKLKLMSKIKIYQ